MAGAVGLGTCAVSTDRVALTKRSRLCVSTAPAMLAFPVPESSDTEPSDASSSRLCQATCKSDSLNRLMMMRLLHPP